MKWPSVVKDAVAALHLDGQLVAALGGEHVYPSQASRPVRIPSVEWTLVDNREDEVMEGVLVQFDYWAPSMAAAVAIEARIRAVLGSDVRRVFRGTEMATLYRDSRTHQYPEPGIVHRSLDFYFEPVRARKHHT